VERWENGGDGGGRPPRSSFLMQIINADVVRGDYLRSMFTYIALRTRTRNTFVLANHSCTHKNIG
jgi:hypothetical protein